MPRAPAALHYCPTPPDVQRWDTNRLLLPVPCGCLDSSVGADTAPSTAPTLDRRERSRAGTPAPPPPAARTAPATGASLPPAPPPLPLRNMPLNARAAAAAAAAAAVAGGPRDAPMATPGIAGIATVVGPAKAGCCCCCGCGCGASPVSASVEASPPCAAAPLAGAGLVGRTLVREDEAADPTGENTPRGDCCRPRPPPGDAARGVARLGVVRGVEGDGGARTATGATTSSPTTPPPPPPLLQALEAGAGGERGGGGTALVAVVATDAGAGGGVAQRWRCDGDTAGAGAGAGAAGVAADAVVAEDAAVVDALGTSAQKRRGGWRACGVTLRRAWEHSSCGLLLDGDTRCLQPNTQPTM